MNKLAMRSIQAAGLALALAVLVPVHARAQVRVQSASADATGVEKAVELEKKAESYAERRERWSYAASLYRKAAQLRPAGDHLAVDDLVTAARLDYYLRNWTTAIGSMEEAANTALAGGDVVRAAHLFVDAAWLAQRKGDEHRAGKFVAQAEQLMRSPLLSTAHRSEVLSRIDNGGRIVSTATGTN